jgi:hypothetical protein
MLISYWKFNGYQQGSKVRLFITNLLDLKLVENDETLPNFNKTKHPTKGENKEQKERSHD